MDAWNPYTGPMNSNPAESPRRRVRWRRVRWRRLIPVFAGMVAVLLGAPHCAEPPPRPHVLLIIMDTTRADVVGAYGGRAATPTLSELAGRGTLFEHVTAHNPFTLGSVATVFTSLPPDLHGIKGHSGFELDDRAITLAEVLDAEGYATAAFVSAVPLRSETGVGQGFAVYDDDLSMPFPVYQTQFRPIQESLRGAQRRGNETVTRAVAWLRQGRPKDRPFFLAVHLFDPHEPYDPPPPFQTQYASDPYAGEVAFTDAMVGDLMTVLRAQGLAETTVVCVVADHGESFGEHDEVGHGTFLYEATLHVPWIMAGPGVPHLRVQGMAGLIDVAPTLLGALNISLPEAFQGEDLLSSVTPDALASTVSLPSRSTYAETYYMRMAHGWSEVLAWREDDWKYVHAATPELFDTRRDPREETNLVESDGERVREMSRQLQLYLNRTSPYRLSADTEAPDEETAEQLRSLGYVGDAPKERGDLEPGWELGLPDPKIAVIAWNRRQRAQSAYRVASSRFEAGAFEEALRWADEALGLDSNKLEACKLKGRALVALGRTDEARTLYREALVESGDDPDLWCGMGMAQDRAGQTEEARRSYERALDLEPMHSQANLFRGYQLARAQDYAGSLPYYDRAFRANPKNVTVGLELARVHLQLDDRESAKLVLQKALRADPTDPDALLTLAQVCQDLDDAFCARQAMEVFLQVHPSRPEAQRVARALQRLNTSG